VIYLWISCCLLTGITTAVSGSALLCKNTSGIHFLSAGPRTTNLQGWHSFPVQVIFKWCQDSHWEAAFLQPRPAPRGLRSPEKSPASVSPYITWYHNSYLDTCQMLIGIIIIAGPFSISHVLQLLIIWTINCIWWRNDKYCWVSESRWRKVPPIVTGKEDVCRKETTVRNEMWRNEKTPALLKRGGWWVTTFRPNGNTVWFGLHGGYFGF